MKLKRYLTEVKEFDILYNDFIDYMLKKNSVNINIQLKIKKKIAKKYFGYVDLKALAKGKYIIDLFDAAPKILLQHIAHELTHIIQYVKGYIKYSDNQIIWKGKPIIDYKEYSKASHSVHDNLPFEIEANKNKALVDKYIEGRMQSLKGISPTMDFMIEYI